MKCLYLNARSILNKVDDLHLLISQVRPDIILITESWLSVRYDSSILDLTNNYVIFRKDRQDGNDPHGGVLLAVKINLNPISVQSNSNHEVLFVDLKNSELKVRLCVVYRPPSFDLTETRTLIEYIKRHTLISTNVCIVGDFNMPGIDWESYLCTDAIGRYLLDFVSELALCQLVKEPTRELNILDLVLCNSENMISNVEVHEPFSTSDHSYITFDMNYPEIDSSQELCFDYRNTDWELMRANLGLLDWDELMINLNLNCEEIWNVFKEIIHSLVNLYVPSYVKSGDSRNVPWCNPTLKRMSRVKKRMWKIYKRTQSRQHLIEYRSYSKETKIYARKCRSKYEKRKFQNKSVKSKEFFNYIDRRTKSRSGVSSLNTDSGLVSNDIQKANALNIHYSNIFTRDNGVIPNLPERMPSSSFSNVLISDETIIKAIKKLNPSGSYGIDDISPLMIKNVFPYLIKPLKYLFNVSLQTGCLPSDWKKGIICPIYKNTSQPHECSSYRPICLTSIVCKILEYLVQDQLTTYLMCNSLISEKQHGFLSKRSTTTNLLSFLDFCTRTLDEKQPVDVVYLDMAKAFDTVSHPKLLYKLSKIGIGGELLRWIENFLCGREQCVRVGSDKSDFTEVLSGIPQGTVLGPLLFVVYINDLNDHVLYSNVNLYADDSKIFKKVSTIDDRRELESDLLAIEAWMSDWQMSLNVEKSEILYMGYNNDNYQYSLNGQAINHKDVCRDLGVLINERLTFSNHCSKLARSAHFRRRQFEKAFACDDRDFRVSLFCTYIRPILESNTVVWCPHHIRDINLIENVQRKFTKYIPGMFRVPYQERLRMLGLETLEVRRIKSDLTFLFKLINEYVDFDCDGLFSFNLMNTRGHPLKINVQRYRLDLRKYFFINRVTPIWNSLPTQVVTADSVKGFRRGINSIDFSSFCYSHLE